LKDHQFPSFSKILEFSYWPQEQDIAKKATEAKPSTVGPGKPRHSNCRGFGLFQQLQPTTRQVRFCRMRSKGSCFTLGVWGLRVCSLDVAFTFATVRNCPQLSATVRNRPQPSATVRNRRQRSPTVRNRWQPSAVLLYDLAYIVSSAEGVVFGGFKRRVASFRVAGVALRDIQTCLVTCRKSFCVAGAILLRRFQKMRCSFRGRRNTLDVFIVILRGRRSTLDGRVACFFQIGLAGLLQAATRCRFRLERNIDFEVANLEVPKKTPRKTSILRLQSVKVGGSLARNARFAAPTCLVSSLWFSCGLAGSCNTSPFRRCSSRLSCRFAWQVWHFVTFQPVLYIQTPGSTLPTPHCTLHTLHFPLYTLHSTPHTLHCTLLTPHFTLHTSHSTLYTPHCLLYTPHSALHILHFPLHTPHSTFYTPHSALYTLDSTLYTPHSTLRMPAEGRTRLGKSIYLAQTGKTHSCRRTWM